jgi:hypothetical protein
VAHLSIRPLLAHPKPPHDRLPHSEHPRPWLRYFPDKPPHGSSLLSIKHCNSLMSLQIPAYILFILQLLFWTWLSEKLNERFLVALCSQIWAFPLLFALEFLPKTIGPWPRWTISTLLVGHPYVHAILVAITSRNAGTVRTRTVASALYNMCVQASSIIASNIYRDNDRPLYRKGNKVLIAICCYNFLVFVGAKIYYKRVNARRDWLWNGMDKNERERYLESTKDKGNKR